MLDRLDGSSNQCGSSVSFAVLLCEIPNDARSRAVQKLLLRGSEAGERERVVVRSPQEATAAAAETFTSPRMLAAADPHTLAWSQRAALRLEQWPAPEAF